MSELFNRPSLQQRVPVLRRGGTRFDLEQGPPVMVRRRGLPPFEQNLPVSVERQEPPVLSERVISTTIAPPVLAGLADFFTALNDPRLAGQQSQGRILQARQDLADQRALLQQGSQLELTQAEFQQAAEERAEQRRLQTRREEFENRRVTVQEERLLQQERLAQLRAEMDILKMDAQDDRQRRSIEGMEKRFLDAQARQDARQLRGFEHQIRLMKERQTVGPAQRTALAEMRGLRDIEFANVSKLFYGEPDKPGSGAQGIIGPAMSRGRTLATAAGFKVDPRFLNLKASVAGLRNKLLKTRSGAAVTDQELRRIATEELPNENDTAQNFEIKLDTALSALRQTIAIYEEVHGIEPGGDVGAPTTGPKVGDRKTFPNGKVGEWDGSGWVLVQPQ